MCILTEKDAVITGIKTYSSPKWMWLEIWEMSEYEIQLVLTINKEELCHFDHKVIHICSADPSIYDDIVSIKKYGKSLVRYIRRRFPDSKVCSRLYYKS